MTEIQEQDLRFPARDGFDLGGRLYSGPEPQIGVLISAGTGYPHRVYARIARHLAARGAVVLCYDYRGIGDSPDPAGLRASRIDYPDWGRFDQPAALDQLAAHAPGLPLTHIGHSVGGHFLGLMDNHAQIARHAFLCVGSGYWGDHLPRNWPLEAYFWWGAGAFSLWRWGHVAQRFGWRGAPLPGPLFRRWRSWSHRKNYLRDDMDALAPHHYEAVRAPIRSWLFTDDPIATPRAAQSLMAIYPNAPQEVSLHPPSDFGLRKIGHDSAFRAGLEPLWDEVWNWLSQAAPE